MGGPEAQPVAYAGSPPQPRRNELVDWITDGTRRDRTVLTAIPPLYARYATVVVPDEGDAKARADAALVEILQAHTPAPWWLGYLETGVADVVDRAAPRLSVYVGWPYVLMQGGAHEALSARSVHDTTPWHSALPELLFPVDRSWLVSTMWDDDWRCVGGPAALVEALLTEPALDVRAVSPDEDATPPGHEDG